MVNYFLRKYKTFKKMYKFKFNWSELLVPSFVMLFCISYIIQVIHINFQSIALGSVMLILIVPLLIVLILRNIKIVRRKELNSNELDLVKKSGLSLFILNIKSILNIKKIRVIIIFSFCLGIIERLFGFICFILFFNMLTLCFIGVKNKFYIIIFSCVIAFLIYYIFGKILYVPFPKGYLDLEYIFLSR